MAASRHSSFAGDAAEQVALCEVSPDEASFHQVERKCSGDVSRTLVPDDIVKKNKDNEYWIGPDGGWGWIVCFGSFVINFILDGTMFSFGVLMLDLLVDLSEDKSTTSWIGSTQMGIHMLMGPFISILLQRLSIRQVTIAGSLLSVAGFIASVFAPNVYVLIFTFGVVGGIGIGMVFLPAIIVVGLYFNKKRAIATGIATSGSGLGVFVYAYITNVLLENFNWRGTVLILAGLILNCVVCSLLFRPLVQVETRKMYTLYQIIQVKSALRTREASDSSGGSTSLQVKEERPVSHLDGIRTYSLDSVEVSVNEVAGSGDHKIHATKKSRNSYINSIKPNLTFSTTNIFHNIDASDITTDECGKESPDISDKAFETSSTSFGQNFSLVETLRLQGSNSTSTVLEDLPQNADANNRDISYCIGNIRLTGNSINVPHCKTYRNHQHLNGSMNLNHSKSDSQLVKGLFDFFYINPNGSDCLKTARPKGELSSDSECLEDNLSHDYLSKSADYLHNSRKSPGTCIWKVHSENTLRDTGCKGCGDMHEYENLHLREKEPLSPELLNPMLRQDIWYSGSVSHLPGFQNSSSLASVVAVMTRQSSVVYANEIEVRKRGNDCAKCFPSALLTNQIFLLLLMTFTLVTAQSVVMTYLPDFAVNSGISRSDAAFLISIVGITNTLGRLVAGLITDCLHIPSIWLFCVALSVAALVNLLIPFCEEYVLLQVCSAVFGLCMAVAVSMRTIVLAEQLGIAALTESFGIVAFFQGIAFIVGPPIAGKLINNFHSFKPPFVMASIMYGLSAVTTFVVGCLNRSKVKYQPTDHWGGGTRG